MYWHMGRHLDGRETLRRVLALPGGSPHARARALQAVSLVERPRACLVHPSAQCAAAADESLQIFEAIGDRRRAAFSRLLLSVEGVADTSRADMRALLEDADREFAALKDDWGQAVAGFVRMETLAKRGDEPGFRAASADATARFRALGDGWGLSAVLYHCGWALSRFGHHAEAVPVLEEAIGVASAPACTTRRNGQPQTWDWRCCRWAASTMLPRVSLAWAACPTRWETTPAGSWLLRGGGARPTSGRPHDGATTF